MIVELVAVSALVALTGVGSWRWRARRAATPRPEAHPSSPSGPRGLLPADVLAIPGEELVLEHAVELAESAFVARLFRCVASPKIIVQLDPDAERLLVVEPVELLAGRVPDQLELEGRVLTLVRRGRAVATLLEQAEGWPAGPLDYVVLADRAGRHVVVLDAAARPRLAFRGEQLDRRAVDLLPGR